MKTYQFNMTLSTNDNVSEDEILDKLIEFAEANGFTLGGGISLIDSEDETEYLLSNESNKDRLLKSIKEVESGKNLIEFDPTMDSDDYMELKLLLQLNSSYKEEIDGGNNTEENRFYMNIPYRR